MKASVLIASALLAGLPLVVSAQKADPDPYHLLPSADATRDTVNEPFISRFSMQAAAGYLDGRAHQKSLDTVHSDGYGTGFVAYALARGGMAPLEPRLREAVAWLKEHQRSTGGWFTPSPFIVHLN